MGVELDIIGGAADDVRKGCCGERFQSVFYRCSVRGRLFRTLDRRTEAEFRVGGPRTIVLAQSEEVPRRDAFQ